MEVCDSPVSEAGVSDNHLYVGRDEDGVAAAVIGLWNVGSELVARAHPAGETRFDVVGRWCSGLPADDAPSGCRTAAAAAWWADGRMPVPCSMSSPSSTEAGARAIVILCACDP